MCAVSKGSDENRTYQRKDNTIYTVFYYIHNKSDHLILCSMLFQLYYFCSNVLESPALLLAIPRLNLAHLMITQFVEHFGLEIML